MKAFLPANFPLHRLYHQSATRGQHTEKPALGFTRQMREFRRVRFIFVPSADKLFLAQFFTSPFRAEGLKNVLFQKECGNKEFGFSEIEKIRHGSYGGETDTIDNVPVE